MRDPLNAWLAIKDSLSAQGGCPQWLPEARLLRVLPCGHHYAWNVQHAFQRRRGTVLLLSPLDWLVVEIWADAGIPLSGILRGIDAVFDVNDRRPHPRQINSLAFYKQHILREAALMKEAAVGSHCGSGEECKEQPKTLLIALPPNGKKIFAALQQEERIERVAAALGFGIAMTVHPDEYQKHEALRREGIHLEFLDPESAGLGFYPGSRLAGRTHRRSRQSFYRGGPLANSMQLSYEQYLTLRNTVMILGSCQAQLTSKEIENLNKWRAAVTEYESAHPPSIQHCLGCYDLETCPGMDLRTKHCADCVLGDEEETIG